MVEKPVVETAYRAEEPVLVARLETLLAKREAAREDIADVLFVIHRRRARILAGRCGLAGAGLTVGVALVQLLIKLRSWQPTGALTMVLLGSAALAFIVYGVATADPRGHVARRLGSLVGRGSSLRQDVERLQSDRDLWALREEAASLEKQSIFAPLGALALLLPLVLHFFCGLVITLLTHSGGDYMTAFDAWIVMSIGLVGVAHGALVYRSAKLTQLLAFTPDASLGAVSLGYGWRTLGWVTLYACLPGAILWLVPVIIAALTGVFLIPVLFLHVGKLVARERVRIGLPPVT